MLSIVFGLLSAISWGAGDFTGGLAARKVGAVRAVFYASVIGLIAVTISAWAANEAVPSLRVWLIAMLAGIFGSTGLILLYAAMANGTMSIAAPVSALLAAALPVLVGTLTEGLPETLTLIGFGFALFAVWMVSQSEGGVKDILSHLADLKLPLLAGLGFGGYFIVMHRATDEGALLWAMTGSRSSSVLLIFIYMLVTRTSFRVDDRSSFPVIGVNGVLDLTGKELISKFIDGYGCHHKSRVIRELWLVASKYYESNHKTINRMYLAWIYPDSIETTPID